jgi:hypothetical protein
MLLHASSDRVAEVALLHVRLAGLAEEAQADVGVDGVLERALEVGGCLRCSANGKRQISGALAVAQRRLDESGLRRMIGELIGAFVSIRERLKRRDDVRMQFSRLSRKQIVVDDLSRENVANAVSSTIRLRSRSLRSDRSTRCRSVPVSIAIVSGSKCMPKTAAKSNTFRSGASSVETR